MPEIIKLRNRILKYENLDFFEYSTTISRVWVRLANREYQQVLRQGPGSNTKPDTDGT